MIRMRNEPSPEIPLTWHISRFFPRRLWLVAGVCVRVCACGNTENPEETERNACGMVVCVVWCCEVRKCEKTQEIKEQRSKHGLLFSTILPSTDPKTVQKRSFSPTHCFYTFPGIYRRFWPEVLPQTPKNTFIGPKSCSKGPNHALDKVPTSETPCIFV